VVVLYRTVHHNPPHRDDFRSARDLGVRKPNQDREVFWLGFSAFDTYERAHAIAMKYPLQGNYVAELDVPDASIIAFDRDAFTLPAAGSITITRSFGPGHWTVWGDPGLFLSLVLRVIPIKR
jgi:hypothetical protein